MRVPISRTVCGVFDQWSSGGHVTISRTVGGYDYVIALRAAVSKRKGGPVSAQLPYFSSDELSSELSSLFSSSLSELSTSSLVFSALSCVTDFRDRTGCFEFSLGIFLYGNKR